MTRAKKSPKACENSRGFPEKQVVSRETARGVSGFPVDFDLFHVKQRPVAYSYGRNCMEGVARKDSKPRIHTVFHEEQFSAEDQSTVRCKIHLQALLAFHVQQFVSGLSVGFHVERLWQLEDQVEGRILE